MISRNRSARSGSLMLETIVAVGILGGVLAMLGQVGAWSLRERLHNEAKQTALELAANLLEAARARDWDALTPAWAADQTLPDDIATTLIDGSVRVAVETDKDLPLLKRVTVEVRWRPQAGMPKHALELVTLIAARARGGKL